MCEAANARSSSGAFARYSAGADDLARNPVAKQDLDRHRAPAQRVTGAVISAKPQQRLQQVTVIRIVEPDSVLRRKEPILELAERR